MRPLRGAAQLLWPPLAVFAGVVLVWELAVRALDVPLFVLPPPSEVARAAAANGAKIARATMLTGSAAIAGLLLSTVVGSLIAFAFSQSRLVQRAFYPYAIFLQTVPIVAIAPVIILWFGQGFASVVLVAHIVSLFPIITNTTQGLTSVEKDLLELFAVHDASRLQVLFKLRFPNAVPSLATGVKVSSGLSVIGAIVGEFFAGYDTGSQGIGYLIQAGTGQLRTAELFATILAATGLGLAIFGAATLLGNALTRRWRENYG